MRTLCFVVVMVLAGCRKPAPAVLAFAVPTAPSTLSLLEPVGANCEWRQVEPVKGTTVVLATFPGTCVGARLSFSPDASKAVVWFDPSLVQRGGYSTQVSSKPGFPDEEVDEKALARAFVVSTRKPQVEPVPLPALPGLTLQELGVDAKGAVLALLEEPVSDEAVKRGAVTSGAETFSLAEITDGLPVMVHAYRREGAAWKRVETKLSTTGWDYGLGVKALEAHQQLGPRSIDLCASHAQGDAAGGDEAASLQQLSPRDAGADDGQWIFLGAGGARVFAWEISGEFAHTTGLIASGAPAPKVLPKLGFTDGDLVALRTSGPHLLISASNVGTHPRLYEFPAGTLVFSSDTARAATFWPTTAKPESHEAD